MRFFRSFVFSLLALSAFSCINYEEVKLIEFNDAQMLSLSPEGAVFKLIATVKNPNDYTINLQTKDLKVFINDNFLGTANFKEKVKLEKNSTKKYEVIVVSSIPTDGNIDIGTITASALFSGLKVKVEGDVKATAKGLSKTIAISFTEKVEL